MDDLLKIVREYESLNEEACRVCKVLFPQANFVKLLGSTSPDQLQMVTLEYSYFECDSAKQDIPAYLLFANEAEILEWDTERREEKRQSYLQTLTDSFERDRLFRLKIAET